MAVYFIRAGEDGPVKIGWSGVPKVRLTHLQTAHHERLTLLRYVECSRSGEQEAQRSFRPYRENSEWFHYDTAMEAWSPNCGVVIKLPARPVTDPQIIEILAEKAGGHVPLATRLTVTRQTLWAWKSGGIPKFARFAVAALAGEYGVDLPEGFTSLEAPQEPETIAGAA